MDYKAIVIHIRHALREKNIINELEPTNVDQIKNLDQDNNSINLQESINSTDGFFNILIDTDIKRNAACLDYKISSPVISGNSSNMNDEGDDTFIPVDFPDSDSDLISIAFADLDGFVDVELCDNQNQPMPSKSNDKEPNTSYLKNCSSESSSSSSLSSPHHTSYETELKSNNNLKRDILHLINQRKKDSSKKWLNQLSQMVKQLEEALSITIRPSETHMNITALESKLRILSLDTSKNYQNADKSKEQWNKRKTEPTCSYSDDVRERKVMKITELSGTECSMKSVTSTKARRRLLRDLQKLQCDPPYGLSAVPIDKDIMRWEGVILGPTESPWEGGIFKLILTI